MPLRIQVRLPDPVAQTLTDEARRAGRDVHAHVRSILEDRHRDLLHLRSEIDRLHAVIERLEPREDDAIAEELVRINEQMAVLRNGSLAAMETLIMLRGDTGNPQKIKAARNALKSAGYEPWSMGD